MSGRGIARWSVFVAGIVSCGGRPVPGTSASGGGGSETGTTGGGTSTAGASTTDASTTGTSTTGAVKFDVPEGRPWLDLGGKHPDCDEMRTITVTVDGVVTSFEGRACARDSCDGYYVRGIAADGAELAVHVPYAFVGAWDCSQPDVHLHYASPEGTSYSTWGDGGVCGVDVAPQDAAGEHAGTFSGVLVIEEGSGPAISLAEGMFAVVGMEFFSCP